MIVADHRAADKRLLPHVMQIYFGNGDIELAVQT
jgi:hypothetical protein